MCYMKSLPIRRRACAPHIRRTRKEPQHGKKESDRGPEPQELEDVNDALRQIAEAQIAIGDIESDMQKQIIGARR